MPAPVKGGDELNCLTLSTDFAYQAICSAIGFRPFLARFQICNENNSNRLTPTRFPESNSIEMAKKFGFCNQRNKEDISRLNFARLVDELGLGGPIQFEKGISRLMAWQSSILSDRDYVYFLKQFSTKIRRCRNYRAKIGAVIRRGALVENYLRARIEYKNWVDNRQSHHPNVESKLHRQKRIHSREKFNSAKLALVKAKMVSPRQTINHILMTWSIQQIGVVIKANAKTIVSKPSLLSQLVDRVAPRQFSQIVRVLKAEQIRSYEKQFAKDIEFYLNDATSKCIARFLESSSLLRRKILHKGQDESYVQAVFGALEVANFEEDSVRNQVVDNAIEVHKRYADGPLVCDDPICTIARLGFDRHDVVKRVLKMSRSPDHEDKGSAMLAMAKLKIKGQQIMRRNLELFDEFVEQNSDYPNKYRFCLVCEAHPEHFEIIRPLVMANSGEESITYLIKKFQK